MSIKALGAKLLAFFVKKQIDKWANNPIETQEKIFKQLIKQAKNDFKDMYYAKEMYLKTKNIEYLDFIMARSKQMINDVKVLSDRAKREIAELQQFAENYKK